jgi:hypothetical protein
LLWSRQARSHEESEQGRDQLSKFVVNSKS